MLAMAPLPGWGEGTATGAIVDHWRQRCRGAQEGKGERRGDGGDERENWVGIYANPCTFHRDWYHISFKHPLPKMESGNREKVGHVVTTSPILTIASNLPVVVQSATICWTSWWFLAAVGVLLVVIPGAHNALESAL